LAVLFARADRSDRNGFHRAEVAVRLDASSVSWDVRALGLAGVGAVAVVLPGANSLTVVPSPKP